MNVILVTGGVRSGKSDHARQRAHHIGGAAVAFIATAPLDPSDSEMADRIARHVAERPASWMTINAPARAGDAIRQAPSDVVIIDCMTLLAANAITRGIETGDQACAAVDAEVDLIVDAVRSRDGTLIIVTNEVGWGVHAPTALGRWFGDALGRANRRLAEVATEVVLMVCGVPVRVKPQS